MTRVIGTWHHLYAVSKELRADKDILLAAVKQDWRALQHTSEDLRADKDITLTLHCTVLHCIALYRTVLPPTFPTLHTNTLGRV